jgi:hypothetical protein
MGTLAEYEAFCAGNGTASERGGQQFLCAITKETHSCIGDDESDNSDRERCNAPSSGGRRAV